LVYKQHLVIMERVVVSAQFLIELLSHELGEENCCHLVFNATATTQIYTLSLHDALPIFPGSSVRRNAAGNRRSSCATEGSSGARSEEHTSELQSRENLVCRLLLEKKNRA